MSHPLMSAWPPPMDHLIAFISRELFCSTHNSIDFAFIRPGHSGESESIAVTTRPQA